MKEFEGKERNEKEKCYNYTIISKLKYKSEERL